MHCTINAGNFAGNSLWLHINDSYCCSFNILVGKNVLQNVKKDFFSPIVDSVETIADSKEGSVGGSVENYRRFSLGAEFA